MDSEFRNPQDVARATPDRVERVLATRLRRGFESRPFVMRLRFGYDGGRTAPLLYVGNLNRSWSDYINGNARALDMVTGTCTTGRGATGRTQLLLEVKSGRGASDSNLLQLNRILRNINAEALFVDSASELAAAVPTAEPPEEAADDSPIAAESVDVSAAISPSDADDPAPDLAAQESAVSKTSPVESSGPTLKQLRKAVHLIRDKFDAFKAQPSALGLTELNALIEQWQASAATFDELKESQESAFVAKLSALLAAKGDAFVAKQGG
ncbi:MAG: hypothetical protein HOI95_20380 [Chromatiales bacterium]|jgi:hypothetical protein|nr:hypothetical protein [Chromatiales bacterium]